MPARPPVGPKIWADLPSELIAKIVRDAQEESNNIMEKARAEGRPEEGKLEAWQRILQVEKVLQTTFICRLPNTIYQLRTALKAIKPSHTYLQKLGSRIRNHILLQPTREKRFFARRGTEYQALVEDIAAQCIAFAALRRLPARQICTSLSHRSREAVKRQVKRKMKKRAKQSKRRRKQRKRKGRCMFGIGNGRRGGGMAGQGEVEIHFKHQLESSDVDHPWKWILRVGKHRWM